MFSANSSQVSDDKLFVEDVFSTWLYTGNSSTQTITNGIDLAGKGGLVWIKARGSALSHDLYDTARGVTKSLYSNAISAQETYANSLTSFNSSGFSIGNDNNTSLNITGNIYASWTFRKAPKFFDIVTYTGNGSSPRNISHSLGTYAGLVIVKRTDSTGNWAVYCDRGYPGAGVCSALYLNSTGGQYLTGDFGLTETTFKVGLNSDTDFTNVNGASYVAYVFADDQSATGIVRTGQYFGNGSATGPVITLGWEPQWLMIKRIDAGATSNWQIIDNMRGMPVGSLDATLQANLFSAENSIEYVSPTATGFQVTSTNSEVNTLDGIYIYIAIRRGPMRTPTSGTSVFQPVTYTADNTDNRLINTGIVTDVAIARTSNNVSTGSFYVADRLRGSASVATALTAAENTDADSFMTPTAGYGNAFSAMNGFGVGNDITRQLNYGTVAAQIAYAFRRAPSFMDMVCYIGTGTSAQTVSHNLGVVPELIITKNRSAAWGWAVYASSIWGTNVGGSSGADCMFLNLSDAAIHNNGLFNDTQPTSSVFSVGSNYPQTNGNTHNMVAYLFASCPGVSKIGKYTGNGSFQTINCGFSAGARFVMIKRADAAGDWLVFDTARGINPTNDPYLGFNKTDAEDWNGTADSIDADSSGFKVDQIGTTNVNVNGATYIYLAVA